MMKNFKSTLRRASKALPHHSSLITHHFFKTREASAKAFY
jgi:hypothetical protein